ncbi:HAMP domain-containing sensor histidine kinase [Paenibacillus silagei]|uniref:histidine kinase n=1 Tax=Paenibacillus silagei TaxID=1670801 RepID=A0ABS4P2I9_9BACL|nr:HAMP domain-containing sensor histidine kinase [Paenibacillus silagei]MBP2115782.1 signal transduction histidine kinase [Paenibacillus silagei]
MIYMLVFVLIAGLLSVITITGAGQIRNNMFLKYNDSYTSADIENPAIIYNMKDFNTDYSYTDEQIIKLCSFLDSWSILIFFGLATLAASLLFYHNKLKQPIEILREASAKISNNDLDFHIPQYNEDEMGQLCRSFESMRAALEDNNRQMWRSIEDRKQLNAAFSHDLRTPLTVLRGYADFLNRYLPEDKISKEKLLDTITTMSIHILRLENYVQIMGEAQKLEDISVAWTQVEVSVFLKQLSSLAEFLAREHSLELSFENQIAEQSLNIDTGMVTRIYENMIANSLRYASQTISVRFEFVKGFFSITVNDDGKGFSSQDLKLATTPFYTSKAEAEESHYGMGLNICKVLAEKQGGSIQLTNNKSGGACVKVSILLHQS